VAFFLPSSAFQKEIEMEIPLDTLPALAYIKELHFWVVLNKNSEPMSWTDDAVEIAWLSIWVSQKGLDAESESVLAKATTRPASHFSRHLVPA
jgi:hypothetical protein